jgi:hypothetical protein
MDFETLLQNLDRSAFSMTVRQSTWMFPTIETCHVIALVLVVGTIALVDLRLLGVTSRDRPVADVIDRVLPATWGAFIFAAITGSLLFISNAATYAHNVSFRIKLVMLILAGLNMAAFHLGAHKRIAEWSHLETPPLSARIAGGLSLLFWIGVIFAARWVGFTLV